MYQLICQRIGEVTIGVGLFVVVDKMVEAYRTDRIARLRRRGEHREAHIEELARDA